MYKHRIIHIYMQQEMEWKVSVPQADLPILP